jgi:hypothetical protein
MFMTLFVLFANDINIMAGPKSGGTHNVPTIY